MNSVKVMIPPPIKTSMLLINCINHLLLSSSTKTSKVLVINYEGTPNLPIYRFDWTNRGESFTTDVVPDVYILKTNLTNLNATFESLGKRLIFNPEALTIFLTNNVNEKVFFQYFAETFMVDMIVIKDSSTSQLDINKFKAISRGKSNIILTINVENCVFTDEVMRCNETFSKQIKISTLKVGLSTNNPPTAILKDDNSTEGVDMEVLSIITRRLNVTMDIIYVDEFAGMRLKHNCSFTGALGSLERREVDMVAGGLIPRSDSYLFFKYTRHTTVNRYIFMVPAAKIRPYWKRVLKTYKIEVWTLLFLSFLLAFVVALLINRLTTRNYHFTTELLKLYAMCLTSIEVKYKELTPKRILYISWYLFLLVFSNYFTAKLLSNLVVKKYEYQVHTIEELWDLNWEICMFVDLAEYIKTYANHKVVTCYQCARCSKRTARGENLVSIRSENIIAYDMVQHYMDEHGEPLISLLDEYFLVTFDVIIFRKNHPIYKRFNEMLHMLGDSGLYGKILSNFTSNRLPFKKVVWKGLAYDQLSFIFLFLMFAFPCTVLLFVAEVKSVYIVDFFTRSQMP